MRYPIVRSKKICVLRRIKNTFENQNNKESNSDEQVMKDRKNISSNTSENKFSNESDNEKQEDFFKEEYI